MPSKNERISYEDIANARQSDTRRGVCDRRTDLRWSEHQPQ